MIVQIFAMGGTIDKVYYDDLSDYKVGEPQAPIILKKSSVNFDYRVESIVRKDSLHLTDEDRRQLFCKVKECPVRHILITHGTDSMVQTAEVLKSIEDKVIVITGSMIPYRFKVSDAKFNIGCAIGAMQILPAGTYIAMSGRIFPAGKVRKNREAGWFESLSAETI